MLSTQLRLLSAAEVEGAWPFVGDRIEEALARSSLMDGAFAKACLEKAEWQLWLVGAPGGDIRAIVITTLDAMPKGRVCTLIVCTGEGMAEWVHHLAEIEQWARDVWGCRRIKAWARPGWERVLKDYRRDHVVLVKEIGNE